MSRSIISDNWALQTVSRLIDDGIDSDNAHLIIPNKKKESHSYQPMSSGIIAIESLFDLITDIVLRDQILVDKKFASTWLTDDSPLKPATDIGVIRPFEFLLEPKRLEEPRDEFVNRLCVTDSLRGEHQENVTGWTKNRFTPNPYLSQTLWGGAGMLARAFVYERGYTPHPVRRRLFQSAGIAFEDTDATIRLCSAIKERRAAILAKQSSKDELYSAQLCIDALPLLVIREAEDMQDILPIALQLRDDYIELRNWLWEFQDAIARSDFVSINKHQKVLKDVSNYIDSRMGIINPNAPTFTVGISIFKMSFKASPLNSLRNQFGTRSMINNLILGPSGKDQLKKLLKILGHSKSKSGMAIIRHFQVPTRTP